MRRVVKVLGIVVGCGIVLLLALLAGLQIVIRTEWAQRYARERIAAAVDDATGGKASIGRIAASLARLSVELDDIVLHGTEGPSHAPLLRARDIRVVASLSDLLHGKLGIDSLTVDQPQASVQVAADGTTNIPKPKTPSEPSNKNPLQTLIDLAVRHAAINGGLVQFADRKVPLNVHGDNLHTVLAYRYAGPHYVGAISMSPMVLQSANNPKLPVNVNIPFEIAANGLSIDGATFETPASRIDFTAAAHNLNAPRGFVRLSGRLSLAELASRFDPSMEAQVRTAPPVTFRLAIGADENRAELSDLQLALGGTRLNASGTLSDFRNTAGQVRFNGHLAVDELGRILKLSVAPRGAVDLAGNAKLAGMNDYNVAAQIEGRDLAFSAGNNRMQGVRLVSSVRADSQTVAVKDLRLAVLGGTLTANGELDRAHRTFRLDAQLSGFDLRNLAQNYASRKFVWDGTISGPVHAEGTLKAPVQRQLSATTRLTIAPGHRGVPLSGLINGRYDGRNNTISLSNSYVALPSTRLGITGVVGRRLDVQLASRNLDDFLPALAVTSPNPPSSLPIRLVNGSAALNATVTGALDDPHIDGHIALKSFQVQNQKIDQVAADVRAAKNNAAVNNLTVTDGKIKALANASIGLHNWKPTDGDLVWATVSVESADIRELAALAGRPDTPVTGVLKAHAQATGTVGNPNATAQVALTNGVLQGEPYERIQANVRYRNTQVQLTSAQVVAPAGQISANAIFDHPPKQFKNGHVQLHLASSPILLAKLHTIQQRQPDLTGTVQLNVDGSGALQSEPGKPAFVPQNLNARINAHTFQAGHRPLADLAATATTRGQEVVFDLRSKVASADIRGNGTLGLTGNYPLSAKVDVAPVRLSAVRRALGRPGAAETSSFDGLIQAELTASGPAMTPRDFKAALTIAKLELTASTARPDEPQTVVLRNAEPVSVSLEHQVVTVRSAHLTGPSTNFNLGGTVNLASQEMDAHADGNIGLALIHTLQPDMFATGDILVNAGVKGRMSQPQLDGRLQLRNAAVNTASSSNGVSKVNGQVVFTGKQARIENIAGESGGGRITLEGTVGYGGPVPDFHLNATAQKVRVRPSTTLSSRFNAKLSLAGTTENSLLSGNISILEVALHSHGDIGSMLAQTAAPPSSPPPQTGLLPNMRLDVRVDTAPGILFQTALSQNLQAEAHVRVRGNATSPGMLGRVLINEGKLEFFGSQYTITDGVVNFYNPQRILPVVDLGLETQTNGVTVDISVKGPMDHLQLTYHSDPPMQFSDMVSMLATGHAPSTDPVLAAQQPPQAQQSVGQMGASAVLNQAVASPVSGQLQRLFGVTALKIDPQIIGPENKPQAQMTLRQQITRNLDFTYIQDVTSSNPQVIRIEWDIDPVWSAIATRQEDGEFGVDFYYKKGFR